MLQYDFLNTYFPSLDELDADRVLAIRESLSDLLAEWDTDLDTSPNSVFGDVILNPFARLLAGMETAANRLLSDFDLEQVSQGIITNCDYVTRYLKNFAIVDQTTLQSSGVIRLTFNFTTTPTTTIALDRRLQFNFGNNDTNLFTMRLAHSGGMQILPPGNTYDYGFPAGVNARRLIDLGQDTYVVDIPVIGTMTSLVEEDTTASLDMTITGLESATALYDFEFGLPPSSIPTLAAKARETIYAASMNTRGGAVRYLKKEFPDLLAVSPIMAGDTEMIRDSLNPLGIDTGNMDIHVKSSGWKFEETATVRLTFDPFYVVDSDGPTELRGRWYGRLTTPNRPFYIKSVSYPGDTDLDLGLGESDGTLVYSTSRSADIPGLSCGHSAQEDLWIEIKMPGDESLNPLISDTTVVGGVQTTEFDITYYCDPMLLPVSDHVDSDDVRPVGLDLLTRGFLPIHLTTFQINYIRERGRTVDLVTARKEIYDYVRALGWPNLFTFSRIVDAMYYAGATDVDSVDVAGTVLYTPAHKVISPANTIDIEDVFEDSTYRDTIDSALSPPTTTVSSISSMTPSAVETGLGTDITYLFSACGERNVCWLLDEATIEFSEIVR